MLEYRKDMRRRGNMPTSDTPASAPSRRPFAAPTASRAAQAQASGFARLNTLAKSLSASSLPSTQSPPPSIPHETPNLTDAEKEEIESRAVAEDERIVDRELACYENDGIIDEDHAEFQDFDLLRYWQVRYRLLEIMNSQFINIRRQVQTGCVPATVENCTRRPSSSSICCSVRAGLLFEQRNRYSPSIQLVAYRYGNSADS